MIDNRVFYVGILARDVKQDDILFDVHRQPNKADVAEPLEILVNAFTKCLELCDGP